MAGGERPCATGGEQVDEAPQAKGDAARPGSPSDSESSRRIDALLAEREAQRDESLRRACLFGDDRQLEQLLATIPLAQDVRKIATSCLLRVAANASEQRPSLARCAQVCLAQRADVWQTDERGETALHRACARRDRAMAAVLLDAGGRSDAPSARDGNSAAFRLLGARSELWAAGTLECLEAFARSAADGRVARHLLILAATLPPPAWQGDEPRGEQSADARALDGERAEDRALRVALQLAVGDHLVIVEPCAERPTAAALTISNALVAVRDALAASAAPEGWGRSAVSASHAELRFESGCVLADERSRVELSVGGRAYATYARWNSGMLACAFEVRALGGGDDEEDEAGADGDAPGPPACHRQLLRALAEGDAQRVVRRLMQLREPALLARDPNDEDAPGGARVGVWRGAGAESVVVLDSWPPDRLEPMDAAASAADGASGRQRSTPPNPVVPHGEAVALRWADALAYVRALLVGRLDGRLLLGGSARPSLVVEALSASVSRATVDLGDTLALVQTVWFDWDYAAPTAGARVAALAHQWIRAPPGGRARDSTPLPRALAAPRGLSARVPWAARGRLLHLTCLAVELGSGRAEGTARTQLAFGSRVRLTLALGSREQPPPLAGEPARGEPARGEAARGAAVLYGLAATPPQPRAAGAHEAAASTLEWHALQPSGDGKAAPPPPRPVVAESAPDGRDAMSELQWRVRAARKPQPASSGDATLALTPTSAPFERSAARGSAQPVSCVCVDVSLDLTPPHARTAGAKAADAPAARPQSASAPSAAASGALEHTRFERPPRRELLGAHARLVEALALPLPAAAEPAGSALLVGDAMVSTARALAIRRQRLGALASAQLCELWTADGGARACGRARVVEALCTAAADGGAVLEGLVVERARPWPGDGVAAAEAPAAEIALYSPELLLAADDGAAQASARHARARAVGAQCCSLALLDCRPALLVVQVAYWALDAGKPPALIGLLHGRARSPADARAVAANLVLTWAESGRSARAAREGPPGRETLGGATVRFAGRLLLPDVLLCPGTPLQLEVALHAAPPPAAAVRGAHSARGRGGAAPLDAAARNVASGSSGGGLDSAFGTGARAAAEAAQAAPRMRHAYLTLRLQAE